MKKFDITTHENGTHSLRELSSGEAMHSRIGPEREAESIYLRQSRLLERLRTGSEPLVLWDVGMGTAANVLIALRQLRESPTHRVFEVHSFESELSGIETALEQSHHFPFLANFTDLVRELLKSKKVTAESFAWTLHEGDFFETMHEASPPDILFYDFYAPRVCPELWSVERFSQIRSTIGEHPCDLYTYTASTAVRAAMLRAGFYVGSGSGTELKLESTSASTVLERVENPLGVKWLEKLSRSGSIPASELKSIRSEILRSRQFT